MQEMSVRFFNNSFQIILPGSIKTYD